MRGKWIPYQPDDNMVVMLIGDLSAARYVNWERVKAAIADIRHPCRVCAPIVRLAKQEDTP